MLWELTILLLLSQYFLLCLVSLLRGCPLTRTGRSFGLAWRILSRSPKRTLFFFGSVRLHRRHRNFVNNFAKTLRIVRLNPRKRTDCMLDLLKRRGSSFWRGSWGSLGNLSNIILRRLYAITVTTSVLVVSCHIIYYKLRLLRFPFIHEFISPLVNNWATILRIAALESSRLIMAIIAWAFHSFLHLFALNHQLLSLNSWSRSSRSPSQFHIWNSDLFLELLKVNKVAYSSNWRYRNGPFWRLNAEKTQRRSFRNSRTNLLFEGRGCLAWNLLILL